MTSFNLKSLICNMLVIMITINIILILNIMKPSPVHIHSLTVINVPSLISHSLINRLLVLVLSALVCLLDFH